MLPILPFEKISKKVGAKRISKNAVEELRDIIEDYGNDIASDSVKICNHAKRRTLMKEDVEFVISSRS